MLSKSVSAQTVDIRHIPRGSEMSGGLYTEWITQSTVDHAILDGTWVARTEYIRTYGDVVVESGDHVRFSAPRIILKPGFHAENGSNFSARAPGFRVKFINMVDPARCVVGTPFGNDASGNPLMTATELAAHGRNLVELLNGFFVNENGQQMVRFSFKSAVNCAVDWADCANGDTFTTSDLYDFLYNGNLPGSSSEMDIYNAFPQQDPNSINIYYYWHPNSSGANRNIGNAPYMIFRHAISDEALALGDIDGNGFLDDDPDRVRVTEIHEMGHIFGLGHVNSAIGEPLVDNIMSSRHCWKWEDASKTNCLCYPAGNYPGDPYLQTATTLWSNAGFFFDPLDWANDWQCQEYKYTDINYPGPVTDFGQAEIVYSFAEELATRIGESD